MLVGPSKSTMRRVEGVWAGNAGWVGWGGGGRGVSLYESAREKTGLVEEVVEGRFEI